jgi:thiamine biosynthesis lipoprotein
MGRTIAGLVLAVVTAGTWVGHGRAAEPLTRYEFTQPHMGTRVRIVLYAPGGATADFARVAELNGIMSDYLPSSELMRLCAKAGGPPVPVGPDLFAVLERAQEVARKSDGAFDVTVGPVVRLWRRARRTQRLPEPDQLAAARALVGYDKVVLDPTAMTVRLTKPGMQLDLGGIAKGYAAQAAIDVLKKQGVTRALVAAGGDIVVSAPPPDEPGWSVAIVPLNDEDKPPMLMLHDAAISTSGDAEQYVEIVGVRYGHIVDPRTGLGLTERFNVTVLARDGTTADAWTKVVAVLGPTKGGPLIEALGGASARVVRKTPTGLETVTTKGFPAAEKAQP